MRHDPFEGLDIPVDPGLEAALAQHNQLLPGHDDDSDEDQDQHHNQHQHDNSDYLPSSHHNEGDVQVHDSSQHHEHHHDDGSGGQYGIVPEGMRFCSGCRANKPLDNFIDGRRMCEKHKKHKPHEKPVRIVEPLSVIGARLQQSSAEKGCDGFEATIAVIDIPILRGVPDPDRPIHSIPLGHPSRPQEDLRTEPEQTDAQTQMRQARALCRPLVEFIQEKTGYSFVYKDLRSGRRLKYQHSLRYLCAQREDQDNATWKKKQAEKKQKAEEDAEQEQLGQDDEPMNFGAIDGDITAATNAAIAAMVQASQGIPADISALLANDDEDDEGVPLNMDGHDEDQEQELDQEHDQSLDQDQDQDQDPDQDVDVPDEEATDAIALAAAAAAVNSVELAAEAADLLLQQQLQFQLLNESSLPDLPVLEADLSVHDAELDENGSTSLAGGDEDDDEDAGSGTGNGKGSRAKSWRQNALLSSQQQTLDEEDQAKNPPPSSSSKKATKPRAPQKKMQRFDCKGSLLININHDGTTAFFVISHQIRHEHYVDVVGNRLRGPRFGHVAVDLSTSIAPPIGSPEFPGATSFDRLEKALKSMLDLVRDLRSKSGGGEEDAAEELYRRTFEARSYRVAVAEALAKGGKERRSKGGDKKRKAAGAAALAAKKRKADEVDDDAGLVDEGALRHLGPPISTDQAEQEASDLLLQQLGLPVGGTGGGGVGGEEEQGGGGEDEGPTAEQMQDLVALYLDRGTGGGGGDAVWALDPALQKAMGELNQARVEEEEMDQEE
ncbi:hypothetical protein RQP46_001469 [Phenoliferia psychrophenolica]